MIYVVLLKIDIMSLLYVKSLFKYLSQGIMGKRAIRDIKPVTDSWVSEEDGLCIRFMALTLSQRFFCLLKFTVFQREFKRK